MHVLLLRFDASNTQRMFGALSDREQQELPFDAASIDWRRYLVEVHLLGLRRFVLHEQDAPTGSG
jgi:hypothetical protein